MERYAIAALLQNEGDFEMKLKIQQIAHYRNGVSGAPFHVIVFTDGVLPTRILATVFPQPGAVSILCLDLIVECCVVACRRGEDYEPALRAAIAAEFGKAAA
jgi:hypothetical protein